MYGHMNVKFVQLLLCVTRHYG